MDLPDSKRREMLERLKGIFTRLHGGEFNPHRMQVMIDKARAAREAAEAPRRTEHFGGIFKYPPIEDNPAPALEPAQEPREEPKVARWRPGFRTAWDQRLLDRMRKAWVVRLVARRSR